MTSADGLYGLWETWGFPGLGAVVSSGLGGGSLIYANVFIRKDEHWFDSVMPDGTHVPWPVTRADLDPHYDNVHAIIRPTPCSPLSAPQTFRRFATRVRGSFGADRV